MGERRTCFVIMPFSQTTPEHTEDYWTSHFDTFLKPLLETGGGWAARRSTALRGDIIREIISDLVTAPAVVADLTDANPNVYWELGVRQSFRHGTVTIAEFGTTLPFDIGGKGTLFYHPHNHIKMEDFRRQLSLAMNSCASEPQRPDSHVLETLSGRGTLYELVRRDEAIRRLDAIKDELNHDLAELERMVERAKKNQKPQAVRSYHTGILRLSCTELLMSTRYLDRDEAFYRLVERVYGGCASINNQLGLWEHSPSSTEKWLVGQHEVYAKIFQELKDALVVVRAEIERRL